jgi:alpha,alpha-trehalase
VSDTPIGDHALLSDCRTAALVSTGGSIEWLCCPRFDSPSFFGRILDDDGGHFSIRPTTGGEVARRYRDHTLVLETAFRTPTGLATLVDALAVGPNEGGHALAVSPPRVLVREVTCEEGEVELEVDYSPRPEYGLIWPVLSEAGLGISARGGADLLALSSSIPLEILADARAAGRFTLRRGGTASFALQHRNTWEGRPRFFRPQDVADMLKETTESWQSWSSYHQNYDGPWADLVSRSGAVLQGLTFQPTGAIVAAPTTSLPETVGGIRNWDYRYAWVRDASLTLEALWVAACPDEATDFFSWISGAVASQVRRRVPIQIMYGVGGERDLTERKLGQLAGWRKSSPVRVGNAAWTQRQLDVYGELLTVANRLVEQLGRFRPEMREFLAGLADVAAERWKEKDHGIWEVRAEPRHFLHSKLMCWVAMDQAVSLADRLEVNPSGWSAAREGIRRAILEQGWSEEAGAYTQFFGSPDLDASALLMPIVGFLPADDPRMLATIRAIEERLTDDSGLVYRYLSHDGLPGKEGNFLLCTFLLAHALALAGEVDRAREVFERAIAHVNDVGLLAEQVDSETGELLGNFPQAYSHIGLVNAAWAIHQAEREDRARPDRGENAKLP